jgi:hypothetical protein
LQIKKAHSIQGKNLTFKDVSLADAGFIFKLRSNFSKVRYLSKITQSEQDQIDWIAKYHISLNTAYFVIYLNNLPIGTVRLYDPQKNSFSWGSWIIIDNAPKFSALESALMVYRYGMEHLGFEESHFDVRKENIKVCNFHKKFGAIQTSEDQINIYFKITREAVEKSFIRYKKYLNSITII